MVEIKRKWDLLSKGERKRVSEELIKFFKDERDEEIGMIAAEEFLDFFLERTALFIYSKGIEDSKILLQKRFEDISIDLDVMGDQ
ncbi:DUF2164 family protein [Patescibacteria group bacterium]